MDNPSFTIFNLIGHPMWIYILWKYLDKNESLEKIYWPLVKSVIKNLFSYFSTKTYVVGTQKNCLNEMVLLSIQNIC